MKLTVLGKYGPYASAGGATSSHLVCGNSDKIVLDFGSGALSRLLAVADIESVSAIVLTHLHYDHISDLYTLSYMLDSRKKKLDLIMPCDGSLAEQSLKALSSFNIISLGGEMKVGEFTLKFTKLRHAVTSYGISVSAGGKTLFYSGDTEYCPELLKAASGADLLLLDCGRPDTAVSLNMSLGDGERLAETLHTPAIITHINPAIEYAVKSKYVCLAEEMKTYEI